jgi:ABC-type Fe3+-siderophore transport system permease subunit
MEPLVAAPFDENQRSRLERLFIGTLVYLSILIAGAIWYTANHVGAPNASLFLICVATGVVGSATGALVSALERHANGLEDRDGAAMPDPEKPKERFSERMFYWFTMRPWLGAVVAAGVFWGLSSGQWQESSSGTPLLPSRVAFYGFLSGLFAKSMLDILRNLPKNVFRQ